MSRRDVLVLVAAALLRACSAPAPPVDQPSVAESGAAPTTPGAAAAHAPATGPPPPTDLEAEVLAALAEIGVEAVRVELPAPGSASLRGIGSSDTELYVGVRPRDSDQSPRAPRRWR